MTTVLTTHYLDEAERLCDRIAIVHEGAIVALDTPAALLARPGRRDRRAARRRRPGRRAGPDARPRHRRRRRLRRRLDTSPSRSTAGRPERHLDAIDRLGIRAERHHHPPPTLDDVYLQLTGSRLAA